MTDSTPSSFPVGSRVLLHSLQKGTEFNGQVGIVKSELNSSSRQQILLIKSGKMLGLKPLNLKYEPRTVNSLSVTELKTVLTEKKVTQLSGYDKSQLRQMVDIKTESEEEIAEIIYTTQAKKAAAAAKASANGGGNLKSQFQNQAQMIGNMSPDQLRQQAQILRSLPPSQVRRMNPQMAGFSDGQIQMAANQMEMMASNPQMMQGMVEQVQNMSEEELEQVKRMHAGGAPPTPGVGQNPMESGMNSMANMTPEQLKDQAEMMKSMDPATLRRMNPAMANWSDAQIQLGISQMETMAKDPEMVRKIKQQMEGMKPEEVENLRKMAENGQMMGGGDAAGAGAGAPAMPSDPMDLLKNANPEQIKSMIKMFKDNPSLMRDMMRSANPGMAQNMTDEQIENTINMFSNLDDRKIGWIVKVLGLVQSLRNSSKAKIAIFVMMSLFVFVAGMLIYLVRQQKSLDESGAILEEDIPEIPIIEESEF